MLVGENTRLPSPVARTLNRSRPRDSRPVAAARTSAAEAADDARARSDMARAAAVGSDGTGAAEHEPATMAATTTPAAQARDRIRASSLLAGETTPNGRRFPDPDRITSI